MKKLTKADYLRKLEARTRLKGKKDRIRESKISRNGSGATISIPDGGTGHPGAWMVRKVKKVEK